MQWKGLLLLLLLLMVSLSPQAEVAQVSAETELPVEGSKFVALTFDDGPRAETTGRLLDGLRERGASATFFVIGQQVAGNEALLRRMQAEGHQVGNHTYNHTKLQGAGTNTVLEQINKTDVILRQLLGEQSYWLRPPYGLIDEKEKKLVKVPMIYWTVDPEDWKLLDAQKVVSAVLEAVTNNGIILMHDFYPTSVDAALEIVDALQAEGYEFVTVQELLALNDIVPQPGVLYKPGRKE